MTTNLLQSKAPLPGVHIGMNSLAINPDTEIPADQWSRFLNTNELGLDQYGITA